MYLNIFDDYFCLQKRMIEKDVADSLCDVSMCCTTFFIQDHTRTYTQMLQKPGLNTMSNFQDNQHNEVFHCYLHFLMSAAVVISVHTLKSYACFNCLFWNIFLFLGKFYSTSFSNSYTYAQLNELVFPLS